MSELLSTLYTVAGRRLGQFLLNSAESSTIIGGQNVSGPKRQPKHKVFGRDIPGTSGTQTSGYPGQKLYASKWPFSVVVDREWPGCPGIWVGTSRIWENFMQEYFGLILHTLM